MEAWYIEVIRQAPSLGVLAWLVVTFLKHLRTTNDDNHTRYREVVENFTSSCGVRPQLDRNSAALDELNRLLHKLNGGE